MIVRTALPFALVLLAGCARSEEANLMPADANGSTRIAETVRPERDDQEPALGAWRETLQDEARAIEFGPTGAPPSFSVRCDARRGILLQRHGIEAAGDLPVMLVSVGSETRRLAVTSGEGPLPMLRASLNASDVLVAGLSRAAAPIAVRIGDLPPLILPPSPLIGAYITQCTTGALPAPGGAAATNQAAPANAGPAD
ncbi:MAG: hypothetical protein QOJ53_238 [Sphingomonadales bacterium]|jgi:hypothetical protein|nr:hypothetical protein [Sphingomonadales bacterium]MEA3044417.1 hypothetical protein [Sphingomonadales bacterium]MEA3045906.1 hypothetical protein [Sphingomonadales bacterium]